MANDGWYKVPREALQKCGFTDKLFAYNDLASRAKFGTGEVWCSINAICDRWGWKRKKSRLFLAWALPMIRQYSGGEIGAQQGHSRGTAGATTPQEISGSTEERGTAGATEGPRRGTITKKKNKEEEYIYSLFNFWNGLKIQVHRKIDKYIPSLNGALTIYKPIEIKIAMSNYKLVLESKEHFFDYRWSLDQFLTRKGGLDMFMDVNNPLENFKSSGGGNGKPKGWIAEMEEEQRGKRRDEIGSVPENESDIPF